MLRNYDRKRVKTYEEEIFKAALVANLDSKLPQMVRKSLRQGPVASRSQGRARDPVASWSHRWDPAASSTQWPPGPRQPGRNG